ncbi:GAF domain-containing protein [Flammeovirga pacifica]|uniref:GAF domain-containing protein n=1 Tax=Flammeovirga pacifica TaxID=915059 RepID=A0A1S1YZ00_FLAPC|nr:GAF domain-containing protein [Flammeovirga pacifica]OHX66095.1 hypothetical protein NH26_06900 [Flammeovirga pacifica]
MTLNTTTIKENLLDLRECIINQLKNNTNGELEILHASIHQLCAFTDSKYGFIGLIENTKDHIHFSNLIECNSFQNSIPMLGNGPLNTSSMANRYLKLVHGKQNAFFNYDDHQFQLGKSWYSFLLIPIINNHKMIGLIGLFDKKGGYNKTLLSEINLCSTALYHVITQHLEKIDIEKAFHVSDSSRFFCDHNIYDIMSTIDKNGTIVLSNIMWNECFGCTKNKILQMILKEDHSTFHHLINTTQKSGLTESAILRMRKENQIIYLRVRVIYLKKKNQIQLIAQNISQNYTQKQRKIRKKSLF